MDEKKRTSALRIALAQDLSMMFLVPLLVFFAGTLVLQYYMTHEVYPELVWVPFLATCVLTGFVAALIIWHILRVHLLLTRGMRVDAIASRCARYPRMGRLGTPYLNVCFKYKIGADERSAYRDYFVDRMTEVIGDGVKVTLMVDSKNPGKFVFAGLNEEKATEV
jgi:hypothetical protein